MNVDPIASVRSKFEWLNPVLDERVRRLWAASEALALGWGGMSTVARATGLSRTTIEAGIQELQQPAGARSAVSAAARIRRPGGGRHRLTQEDTTLGTELEALVEASTRGDPQSPLKWTCKSTRCLAAELTQRGHRISHQAVATLLQAWEYSLQAPRKTQEGGTHPDRNAQFAHINATVQAFQARGQPVVSMDAKKKELVGNFYQRGREWHRQGQPEHVNVYEFPDLRLGKALPYGVYELTLNQGWVSVGITHDTAEFAVATLRRWWQRMGAPVYPHAQELLVTADAGGSNSTRCRLWKVELQKLADATGLRISVCHFPPGTSKWNKIEHRMFCHITENWRGRPLLSRAIIVNLIGHTKTRTGLQIQAELDVHTYHTGIKVAQEQWAAVKIQKEEFHGEWNYTILPRTAK